MKSKKATSTKRWVSKSIKSCKAPQLTEQKYKSRPSPPCHADLCKDMVMFGNDKRLYISKPDSRNIYKWIPVKPKDSKNTYYTHDNGGRPFKVVIKGKELSIYGCNYIDDKADSKYQDYRYYGLFRTFKKIYTSRRYFSKVL
jgi:hypothetical protein